MIFEIFNLKFEITSKDKVIDRITSGITRQENIVLVTLNPEILLCSYYEDRYRACLQQADFFLVDGIGLKLAVLFLYGKNIPRLRGVDFVEMMLVKSREEQYRIAIILRSDSLVDDKSLHRYLSKFSFGKNAVIFRLDERLFTNDTSDDLSPFEFLKKFHPQVVFLAIGAPWQEFIASKLKLTLPAGCLLVGVGGSFDVLAGRLSACPRWLRLLGFEWGWRLFHEPLYRSERVWNAVVVFPFCLLLSRMKKFFKRSFLILFLTMMFFVLLFIPSSILFAESEREELQKEIQNVNNKIELQKSKIDNLVKRMKNYQKNIAELQSAQRNLQSELALIELRIEENQTEMEQLQAEIEASDLDVQNTTLKILDRELLVQQKKKLLTFMLRDLERMERTDALSMMILNRSFSFFYERLKNSQDVQKDIHKQLSEVKRAKSYLLSEKDKLETVQQNLLSFAANMQFSREKLEEQQAYKITLMSQTERSEEKYQELMKQAKSEQLEINEELILLDKSVREKLKELERIGRTNQPFIWPVEPKRGISTYFHDKEYPYRYLFEHPGLDIPAPQGSTIIAPRDGYVARIKSPDEVGVGYAYLMLVHDDGYSTVFGHISCVKVTGDTLVKQGDAIACVGGTPGTLGAGNLTTGAHSHFELRKDGIPIDPLPFLP
jgi:exopolysaccharide biosynthesis WecB/TagA/CpsF family protein